MSGARTRRPRWGKDAEKYLLSDEPPVIATRRHPAVLVRPLLRGLPALVVGVWVLQLDPTNRLAATVRPSYSRSSIFSRKPSRIIAAAGRSCFLIRENTSGTSRLMS